MRQFIPQRSKADWFRLGWIITSNGFFGVSSAFELWQEHAGIGLPSSGFANVSRIGVTALFVLALGIVMEMLRVRGAAITNVGVYAAAVLGTIISAAKLTTIEPLAVLAGVLFAAISVVNLLLYRGVLPRLIRT